MIAIKDAKNPLAWVVFGYENKTSNKLKPIAEGEDLDEIVDELNSGMQL